MNVKKNNLLKVLEELVHTPSNPGDEQLIAEFFKKELVSKGFEIHRDNMGSIFGYKKSKNKNAKTLVIDAHMDDVGFVSSGINKNGFVSFVNKGGIIRSSLYGHKIRMNLKNGQHIDGIVISISPHQISEKSNDEKEIFVDFGFKSITDAKEKGFEIGLEMYWSPDFWINDDSVFGKGLDNKIGLSVVYSLISLISENEYDFNIYIGGTTQEEVGLRGAKTFSQKVNPDYAIVVDTSPSFDIKMENERGKIGEGPFLRIMDRGHITQKNIIELIRKTSEKRKIKLQEYISLGGTNANEFSLQGEGTSIIQMGCLARNIHNSVSVASISDIISSAEMVYYLLEEIIEL